VLSYCCREETQADLCPRRGFSRMWQVNIPVSPQSSRKFSLLFPETCRVAGFGFFAPAFEPHISLSPSRSLTMNNPLFLCRVGMQLQGGRLPDVTRAHTQCVTAPKIRDFSVKLNVGVQRRGRCRVGAHPLCPGLVPPQDSGGCYDAVSSLERSHPTEFCRVTRQESAVCQSTYKFLS